LEEENETTEELLCFIVHHEAHQHVILNAEHINIGIFTDITFFFADKSMSSNDIPESD
jgi:hypothetical protein